MPKLPVCPHCGTIYRYGDVNKIMGEKSHTCYHCKKNFAVSKKKFLILFLIIALFCAIFDVFELCMVANINFIALMVTNIIIIIAGLIFRPLFVKFCKLDS
jgi:hypothetical protein